VKPPNHAKRERKRARGRKKQKNERGIAEDGALYLPPF
jgi:hypothetical protein